MSNLDQNAEAERGNTPPNRQSKLTPEMEANKWKPGQSGNPSGRPKRKPISELYERMMQEPEFMESVENSIRKMVTSGRMVGQLQLKEMAERIEGKITQPIDMELNVSLADRMERARERANDK